MGGVLRDKTILAVEGETQIALTAVYSFSLLLECVKTVWQVVANKQASCVPADERTQSRHYKMLVGGQIAITVKEKEKDLLLDSSFHSIDLNLCKSKAYLGFFF